MDARVYQPVHITQYAPSYYVATLNRRIECLSLVGEEQADVCVVGDGFSGVNTALELVQRGLSVVLLEMYRIGQGVSGRNGGQLTRGVGHDAEQFLPVIGADGVEALKLMGLEAAEIVHRRVGQYAIDCDLRWGYCDLANKLGDYQGFREDMEELRVLGYRHEMRLVPTAEIRNVVGSDRYAGGPVGMGPGHLYLLNLVPGEAAAAQSLGVRLSERSPVMRIDHGTEVQVHTAAGKVRAKTLVLDCNAYTSDLNPPFDGKVLPAGNYVIATEPLDEQLVCRLLPQNMAVCDQHVALDHHRLSVDNCLLFSGACHYSGRDSNGITACMQPKMLEVFL